MLFLTLSRITVFLKPFTTSSFLLVTCPSTTGRQVIYDRFAVAGCTCADRLFINRIFLSLLFDSLQET